MDIITYKKLPQHIVVLSILVIIAPLGCTIPQPYLPVYQSQHLKELNIQKITLFPVIDKRSDRSIEVDMNQHIRNVARNVFLQKGYQVLLSEQVNFFEPTKGSLDLGEMTDSELGSVVPEEADAAAIIYLEDLRSDWGLKVVFATYKFQIHLVGKIIAKNKGIVWQDKATEGRHGGGVLEAALVESMAMPDGIIVGAEKLFSPFPAR